MSYRVIMTATAVKERKRIDSVVRKRIDQALQSLQSEPRPQGAKKLSGTRQDWRMRVGNYRILYEIADDQQLITVWRIAHRRHVYR
ncbi:MAG: type II toxin-antitoxin system RelE/ParE family toxin [Candidatus Promineifilaceae bacterium]|nr:type II toxin-antitoxin system RelE/ParE family toxin [Candidatus Promineifilaceae bacterium]